MNGSRMTLTAGNELILAQLAAGEAEPVLVADFQPFSAAERLSELISTRIAGRPIYQADPLEALSRDRRYVPLPELAAAYAEAFLAAVPGDGPAFLVGQCSAAALSLRIAKLLVATRDVTVILVKPTWPDAEHVGALFDEFQRNLGAEYRPCPWLDGDPSQSVARLEQILREEITQMATDRGLDPAEEAFTELLLLYRSWLAFLLSCRNDLPDAQAEQALADALAADRLTVKVLADTDVVVSVPGLSPDALQISWLPPHTSPDGSATPELAELVLAQIAAH
jgi:hypothetical protein